MMTATTTYPLVSICIPTYNGESFIEAALLSAIQQDYPNLEIVVTDDASSDRTIDIVERFKQKTEIPIHIYKHQPNGIGANWNFCVERSSGAYIKFLFQDDVLKPHCISQMMTMAMLDPKIGLVYSKRFFLVNNETQSTKDFIDFYGDLQAYWENENLPQAICSGKEYLKDKALLHSPKNKIGEPSVVLLKRSCFDHVGWFNEQLKQTLDYEYWYRLMKVYKIAFIDEELVGFRLHEKQASQINKDHKIGHHETTMLHKQYYDHIFWCLHPKNKLKLLKLHHPIVKRLVKLKQRMNG